MITLKIKMFGSLQISCEHGHESGDEEASRCLPTTPCGRSAQTLLAYLVLHCNRMHRREAIAGLIWGEASEERARGALRTALWRLRRVIEPPGIPAGRHLVTTQSEVGFQVEGNAWVDVMVFEKAVSEAALSPKEFGDDDAAQLEASLQLYDGELLEGFYEHWVLQERERMRDLYLRVLTCLMHGAAERGDLNVAIARGRRLLIEDPLRESLHRYVMRLYWRNGQRAEALRQFMECRRILDEELQVEPMAETLALRQEITEGVAPGYGARDGKPDRLEGAMASLQRALVELRHAKDELYAAAVNWPH